MKRAQFTSALIGTFAMIAVIFGFIFDARDFFASYLIAIVFWFGISLGAAANVLMYGLTGGEWGERLRPYASPAIRALPWTAILFVPILFGLKYLYPWIGHPTAAGWLNAPFFIVRAVTYICVWSAICWRLEISARVTPRLAAGGLILYGLTASFAAIDWIMSLMPEWYSTGFALVVVTSQMLAGLGVSVIAQVGFDRSERKEQLYNDWGNLFLMYVLTWMYLAFTQYLIIWAADLPREISWYLPRTQTSWRWLMLLIVILQFALPFVLLLFRHVKRNARALRAIAIVICAAYLLYVFQLIAPTVRPHGVELHFSDAIAFLAVGGLWMSAWCNGFGPKAARPRTAPPTSEATHHV